jgi:hypothetical protein
MYVALVVVISLPTLEGRMAVLFFSFFQIQLPVLLKEMVIKENFYFYYAPLKLVDHVGRQGAEVEQDGELLPHGGDQGGGRRDL